MIKKNADDFGTFSKININIERPFSPNNPQYIDPSAERTELEYGWKPNKNARHYWNNKKEQV